MSPYHHPNQQADYQAALEAAEASTEWALLETVNPLFLEMIEQVFDDEKDFVELLGKLHQLVKEPDYLDQAQELRAWLRGKISLFARNKVEQELPNHYWRNR
jgi:hypothetical protein